MTQDTRKDPRAKIVSLNVRYKSATVDEFIENHSYDVSKGGIYIKTPSPFPPGTLLKFEIRIAGDKAVISGVGRVVWKREAAQSTTERPSGMGVKFIKLDDASRVVIDKLVEAKGADAGIAFEAGNTEAGTIKAPGVGGMSEIVKPASPFEPAPSTKLAAAPVAAAPQEPEPSGAPIPPKRQAHTVIGIGAPVLAKPAPAAPAPAPSPAPAPAPTPAPAPAAAAAAPAAAKPVVPAPAPTAKPATPAPAASVAPQRPVAPQVPRKPAYDPPPRPAAGAHAAPRPAAGEPAGAKPAAAASSMFPKTDSLKEMPPTGEQTVMKQAAELLEEALRGAGGSMEEIGSNPLFDVAMKQSPSTNGSAPTPPPELEAPPVAKMPELDEPAKAKEEAPKPVSVAPTPAPAAVAAEEPTPLPKREPAKESVRPKPAAEPPREVARAIAAPEPAAKGGSGKAIFGLVAVVALAGIGYYAYTQLGESTPQPAPSATQVTQPPPSAAAPQPSSEPSAAAVAPSAAPAMSAAAPTASAATSASAAPATSAHPGAAAASASAAPVAPKPPPPAPVTAAPPPVPAPPPPAPKPAPKPAPAPVNQGSQASDNASPPPAPKPKPKKPADDDNPY